MVDIIQEVEEDLRQERLYTTIKQYAPFVVGAVVIILACTGGYIAWDNYQERQAETGASLFYQALQEKDPGLQRQTLENLAKSNKGYGVLARYKLGAANIEDPALQRKFIQSVQDTSAPLALKNVALVLEVLTAIDALKPGMGEKEGAPIQELLKKLDKAGPAWLPLATLLRAQVLLSTGQWVEGLALLKELLNNVDTPQDVAQLAKAYLDAATVVRSTPVDATAIDG